MIEKGKAESRANSPEDDRSSERDIHAHEAQMAKIEKAVENDAANAKELDPEDARKQLKELDKPSEKNDLDKQPSESAQRILRVPLPDLQPVVNALAKTWTSIRQNLSPSERAYSKVIHNKIVSTVSEFTAKTLARPYAILAGGVTTVI